MCVAMETSELPKLSFQRLKRPLEQVVTISIPRHIRILNNHSVRIHELKCQHSELDNKQPRAPELNNKQPRTSELSSEKVKKSLDYLEKSLEHLEESSGQLELSLELQSEQLDLSSGQLRESELRSEQLRASITVRRLKQDLFELENLNRQVREEDQDLFWGTVKESLRDAIDMLSAFMQLHSDVMDSDKLLLSMT